jgi:hypothetical protein
MNTRRPPKSSASFQLASRQRASETLGVQSSAVWRSLLFVALLNSTTTSTIFADPPWNLEVGANNNFGSYPQMALGDDNDMADGNDWFGFNIFALGNGNWLNSADSSNLLLLGTLNGSEGASNTLLTGTLNTVWSGTTNSLVVGNANDLEQVFESLVVGGNNQAGYFQNGALIGYGLVSNSGTSVIIGRYNAGSPGPFTIGNGTSDSARKNALTLEDNGKLSLFGTGANTITLDPSNSEIKINGQSILASNASGNVGIGTTTPASRLHVYDNLTSGNVDLKVQNFGGIGGSTAATASLTFGLGGGAANLQADAARLTAIKENDFATVANRDAALAFHTTADSSLSEKMRITSAGDLGIGTAVPSSKLHVYRQMVNGVGLVDLATFGDTSWSGTGTAGDGVRLLIGSNARGSGIASVTETTGDWGKKQALVLSSYLHSDMGGTGAMERVRITSSGNVGLGNANPATLLDIGTTTLNGTSLAAATKLFIRGDYTSGSTDATYGGIQVGADGNKNYGAVFSARRDSAGAVHTQIGTRNGGVTNTAITALNNGNVGIGTASPASKLHVNGDLRVTGNILGNFSGTTLNVTGDTILEGEAFINGNNRIYLNGIGDDNWQFYRTDSPGSEGAEFLSGGALVARVHSGLGQSEGFIVSGYDGDSTSLFEVAGDGSKAYIAGDLGIGTASPEAKLDVNGDAIINGPVALGSGAIASGNNSVALNEAEASGDYSFAAGDAVAAGPYSTAGGYYTWATGDYSVAIGHGASADAYEAVALGGWGTAYGYGAVAIGGCNAGGDFSISASNGNASGSSSIALRGTATGEYSVAVGGGTAAADYSMVFGSGIVTGTYKSLVFGFNNATIGGSTSSWIGTDPLLIIGNGNGTDGNPNIANRNAMVIDKNGRMSLFSSSGSTTPTIVLDPTNSQITVGGQALGLANPTTFSVANGQFSVNGSGHLGIGTTAPADILHLSAIAPVLTFTSTNNLSGARYNVTGTSSLAHRFQYNSAELMAITASGNVGIGTTAPTERLFVQGAGTTRIVVKDSIGGGMARLVAAGNDAYVGANSSGGKLYLQSGTAANSAVIDGSGNVGIGTLAPTAKFEVNGSAKFSGPVRIAQHGDLSMGEYIHEP